MGAADVVPGVSGGTIAFITGIYGNLLDSINAFGPSFLRNLAYLRIREAFKPVPWGFLLPLIAGIGTSIISLAKLVLWLLQAYPVEQWSFFFGLIVSSILLMQGTVRKTPASFIFLLAGTAGAWLLTGTEALSPDSVPHTLPVLFASGSIALCAMILPGISGSFLLLLMGQYECILDAVAHIRIVELSVFFAGGICGLLSFSRLLSFCFRNYPNASGAALIGVMLGSLRSVWPWHSGPYPSLPSGSGIELIAALSCALAGMLIPLLLQKTASHANRIKKH